jgi:hypothetical protein
MTEHKPNVRLETAQSYNPAITAADLAAFYAGWEAFDGGISAAENPYPPATADRLAWGAGFAAGKESDEQERAQEMYGED